MKRSGLIISQAKVASHIYAARKTLELTQKQMAKMLCVSERQYRRYETDGVNSIDVLNKIVVKLGINMFDLISFELNI